MFARLSRVRVNIDRAFFAHVLLNAPVAGALYLAVFFGASVIEPLVPADQVLLGRDAKEISDYVAIRFASDIENIGLTLALTAVGIGVALGVIALLLIVLREQVQGLPKARRSGLRAAAVGLVLVALLHASAMLLSMSRWPQIYAAKFWANGGILASVQVLATDRLRTRGLAAVLAAALAVFVLGPPWRWGALVRRIVERAAHVRRQPRAYLTALGLLVAVTLAASIAVGPRAKIERRAEASRGSSIEPAATTPRRRSVLVIASDGFRADRLQPAIAPRLSALADRGARFDRAYVEVARTLSSWTTMLTGLHPHTHGIRSGFPRPEDVARAPDTLPARLRAAGYATAVVCDSAGEGFNRVDLGFSSIEAPDVSFSAVLRDLAIQRSTPLWPFLQLRAGRALFPEVARWGHAADPQFVAADAVDVLRRIHADPFFMIVFFSTTHAPYAAPSPYHKRFTRPDYGGPFRYDKTVMASVPIMPNAEDVVQIRGLYDGAVAAVDDAAGTILDELERLGLRDDTIIVVTSDHGETLFEHDRWHGHGDHLFGDESTHIPLAIVDPRAASPRRENALVSGADLAPTLYDLLGVAPPERMEGRSLAAAVRGGAPITSRPVFSETELLLGYNPGLPPQLHFPAMGLNHLLELDTDHGNRIVLRKESVGPSLLSRHRMVRDDRYKLIYMPTPTGVVYRLFDLTNDPDELVDVSTKLPAEATRLRALLWEWMLGDPLMERDGEFLVPKGTHAPERPTAPEK